MAKPPRRNVLKVLAAPILVGVALQDAGCAGVDAAPDLSEMGAPFSSDVASVNGARLHYIRGGNGPAVLLLHGFPQDWYAYHAVMPRLAASFTIVVPDMRGVGGSDGPLEQYGPATLTKDLHDLARSLDLESIFVVGHDNGGMLAYAFALTYPQLTRGAMVLDCPLPGVDPWAQVKADPALWHFRFHQTQALPELLVHGHQFEYFRSFFDRLTINPAAIPDADVRRYARAYGSIQQLRAGFEFYRQAYPGIEELSATARPPADALLVLAGGDHSVGQINPVTAAALRQRGWRNVHFESIPNSGHWVIDEQPEAVTQLIERHAGG